MKENKSPGVDGRAPKILKETVQQICTPLAHVFNMSLQEGIVPLEWKEANIIPLFKKGSRNKSVNYRPVSLTSVICGVQSERPTTGLLRLSEPTLPPVFAIHLVFVPLPLPLAPRGVLTMNKKGKKKLFRKNCNSK